MKVLIQISSRLAPLLLPLVFILFCSLIKGPAVNLLKPTGEYEFSSIDDGQSFVCDLKIEGEPGTYRGTVKRRDKDISFSFSDVGISGEKMIIVADVRSSVFVLRLYFTGDTFTGNWSLGSDGNELKGKRLK